MERIKNLDWYQKGILVVLLAMAIVFAVVYVSVTSRIGYLYNDQILEAGMENGNTVYRADVYGQEWCFTVTPEKTVTFHCGARTYGPYTAKEDPTAVPEDHEFSKYMTGVEVRDQDEILFRGGIMAIGEYRENNRSWLMYNEDGTSSGFMSYAVMSDGTMISGDGQIVDPMEPSVYNVLRLMEGPELTHKGEWIAWVGGVFLSMITAVSILFADELFRWGLVFRVRDVDSVEPSDWEIACRYIGWTIMTVMTFAVYIMGLQ